MLSVLVGNTTNRDAAILALQLFGVRRAGEVLQVRIEDISWDINAARFRRARIWMLVVVSSSFISVASDVSPSALGFW